MFWCHLVIKDDVILSLKTDQMIEMAQILGWENALSQVISQRNVIIRIRSMASLEGFNNNRTTT